MNNFFIPKVSKRKKIKLKRAGMAYLEMDIDDVNGLVFEPNNIIDGLKIMGLDIIEQEETSIPGILKVKVKHSPEVNFTLEVEAEPEVVVEPEKIEIIVSAPSDYKCDHWKSLIDRLKYWIEDKLGNIDNVKRIFIHEAYRHDPTVLISENELHIVVGRHLKLDGAKKISDRIEYYPASRLICFAGMPECPDNGDLKLITNGIEKYLPALLASTIEEADILVPYEIVFRSWDGEMNKSRVEEIIRKIVPKNICNGVVVKVPHGDRSGLVNDEFLRISMWSAVLGDKSSETPAKMWGYEVGCRDKSFSPTEKGIVIFETGGYPVAEMIGNDLYIFHDISHKDRSSDYAILEKILEEAVKIIGLTEAEKTVLINTPRVLVHNQADGFHNTNKFKTETENVLLPILGRKIIIHNNGGMANSLVDDGTFHIWLASSPMGSASRRPSLPDKIFGFKTNNDHSWAYFSPSETGVEIIDPESMFSVAELFDNNLYIHISLGYEQMSGGFDIYKRILELTIEEFNRTPEEKIERDKAIKEIRRVRVIKNYVQICQKRQDVLVKQTGSELEAVSKNLAAIQKNLIEHVRREAELRYSLNSLMSRQSQTGDEYETEFNRLFEIEGVESVLAKEDKLIVNTYNIYISTRNKEGQDFTFDIGKFRIEIYFNGDRGGILFFNTTRKGKGGYNNYNIHHPHVNAVGEPCLGNIKEMIGQLIAEYQFAAIVNLAIQYLETVNLDDQAGSEIFKCWTAIEKDKETK